MCTGVLGLRMPTLFHPESAAVPRCSETWLWCHHCCARCPLVSYSCRHRAQHAIVPSLLVHSTGINVRTLVRDFASLSLNQVDTRHALHVLVASSPPVNCFGAMWLCLIRPFTALFFVFVLFDSMHCSLYPMSSIQACTASPIAFRRVDWLGASLPVSYFRLFNWMLFFTTWTVFRSSNWALCLIELGHFVWSNQLYAWLPVSCFIYQRGCVASFILFRPFN